MKFLHDRALEEKRARLGLVECVNHDLLQPYPVLHEKSGKKPFYNLFYFWENLNVICTQCTKFCFSPSLYRIISRLKLKLGFSLCR